MTYVQAVVLGVVQGLTEFIPVSSSGHLILVPRFLGWPDQGLAFDAAVHLGTLAALVAYFHAELLGLLRGTLSRRVLALLVAATIPAGLAGLLFGRFIEGQLRSPLLIAATTAGWAVVMALADRRARAPAPGPGDPIEGVPPAAALVVGLAQAIALVPGTSRSGITITAGVFAGLDRATAARFSFLLGIPITAAAGGLKALQLVRAGLPAGEGGPLLVAMAAAFVSGWAAVWFLVSYLRRRSLMPFVLYRLALAALILAVFLRA
jgi:undecaprenyl-diphosphatase